jgi:ABC-type antimicrobial peptide transport system permease subunit
MVFNTLIKINPKQECIMSIKTTGERIEDALKTKVGLNAALILGATFHASLFGTLVGIGIFILSFSFEASDVGRALLFFCSLCLGWLCVFFVSYYLARLEFKEDFKKASLKERIEE